jgi:transposase-like protein
VSKLRQLGYDFNDRGELRQLDRSTNRLTEKPFEFEVKKGNSYFNQVMDDIIKKPSLINLFIKFVQTLKY